MYSQTLHVEDNNYKEKVLKIYDIRNYSDEILYFYVYTKHIYNINS